MYSERICARLFEADSLGPTDQSRTDDIPPIYLGGRPRLIRVAKVRVTYCRLFQDFGTWQRHAPKGKEIVFFPIRIAN